MLDKNLLKIPKGTLGIIKEDYVMFEHENSIAILSSKFNERMNYHKVLTAQDILDIKNKLEEEKLMELKKEREELDFELNEIKTLMKSIL